MSRRSAHEGLALVAGAGRVVGRRRVMLRGTAHPRRPPLRRAARAHAAPPPRRDVAKNLESDFERFDAVSSADRKLVTTLNSSGEARAVAAAVNEKYPTGYLASIMGRDTR